MSYKLSVALDALNIEIEKGLEFPEAIDLVVSAYGVSQAELTQAYDNQ